MIDVLRKNKRSIIEFLIIFLLSAIICFGFIRVHYTTDSYKIINNGYDTYITKQSLKDGRFFMVMVMFIALKTNMSFSVLNYICTILGIILFCFAVMVLRGILEEIIPNKDGENKRIILFSLSYLAIFNVMCVDAFYYVESIVIALSVLFYMISIKFLLKKLSIKNIGLSVLCTLLGTFAYQGTIGVFIAYAVVLILIKEKGITKKSIGYIALTACISIISVLIDVIIIKKVCEVIGAEQTRFNLKYVMYYLNYILKNCCTILFESCGLLNKYVFLAFIIGASIYSLFVSVLSTNNFWKHLINILIINIVMFVACFCVFLVTNSSFFSGRLYLSFGALPIFLIIYAYSSIEKINAKTLILFDIVAFIFLCLTMYTFIFRIADVRKKNRLEKEMCLKVLNYCINENIELKYAMVVKVADLTQNKVYFDEIKLRNSMVINEVRGSGSVVEGFNVNTGCKLKEFSLENEIKEEYYRRYTSGDTGIEGTYIMYIDNVLVLPAIVY